MRTVLLLKGIFFVWVFVTLYFISELADVIFQTFTHPQVLQQVHSKGYIFPASPVMYGINIAYVIFLFIFCVFSFFILYALVVYLVKNKLYKKLLVLYFFLMILVWVPWGIILSSFTLTVLLTLRHKP